MKYTFEKLSGAWQVKCPDKSTFATFSLDEALEFLRKHVAAAEAELQKDHDAGGLELAFALSEAAIKRGDLRQAVAGFVGDCHFAGVRLSPEGIAGGVSAAEALDAESVRAWLGAIKGGDPWADCRFTSRY